MAKIHIYNKKEEDRIDRKVFNLRKKSLYIFRLKIILFIAKLFNVYVDNEYPWVYRYKDNEIEIKNGYVKK